MENSRNNRKVDMVVSDTPMVKIWNKLFTTYLRL